MEVSAFSECFLFCILPGYLVEGIQHFDAGPVVIELNENLDDSNLSSTNGTQPALNIFGGSPAPYGKYPQVCQFVSVFDQINGSLVLGSFCSSTIINEVTIMTNAHCIGFLGGFQLRYRRVYCGVINSPLLTGIVD